MAVEGYMNLIASATLDWGIGFENELLFRVSKDMVRFRKMTTGNVVVMGRNTFLSMPNQKPLPNRVNIVLSADRSFCPDGVILARSLEELLEILKAYDSERVFIIGGAAIYALLLPYCDKLYITRFYKTKKADRFLPDLDKSSDWHLQKRSTLHEQDGLYYTFDLYTKEGTTKCQ